MSVRLIKSFIDRAHAEIEPTTSPLPLIEFILFKIDYSGESNDSNHSDVLIASLIARHVIKEVEQLLLHHPDVVVSESESFDAIDEVSDVASDSIYLLLSQ